jgi:hypothetical protein
LQNVPVAETVCVHCKRVGTIITRVSGKSGNFATLPITLTEIPIFGSEAATVSRETLDAAGHAPLEPPRKRTRTLLHSRQMRPSSLSQRKYWRMDMSGRDAPRELPQSYETTHVSEAYVATPRSSRNADHSAPIRSAVVLLKCTPQSPPSAVHRHNVSISFRMGRPTRQESRCMLPRYDAHRIEACDQCDDQIPNAFLMNIQFEMIV